MYIHILRHKQPWMKCICNLLNGSNDQRFCVPFKYFYIMRASLCFIENSSSLALYFVDLSKYKLICMAYCTTLNTNVCGSV